MEEQAQYSGQDNMKKITALLIIVGTISIAFFVYPAVDRSYKLRTSLRWLKEEQYVPSLGLYRVSPEVDPNSVYIMNDNLLVSLLLSNINLTGYEQYLSVCLPIEILIYRSPKSPPFNGSTNIVVEVKDGYTIKTEIPSGELMDDWNEYADLLAYGILSYHYSGDYEIAAEYFQELYNMWDGKGFVDKPFNGTYQTYKNALFIIVAKTLRYNGPLVCKVNSVIWRSYKTDGGFYTGYLDGGSRPPGVDVNTETTCLVLLAHRWRTVDAIRRMPV